MELQLEELRATRGRGRSAADAGAARRCARSPAGSRCAAPFPAHLPRERVVIPARPPALLRRQARQARREHHRDAGGGAAAMEGDPDRPREVHLPVVREDHPAAGAVPRHPARPCRAEPAGDDPLRQVRRASAAQPAERDAMPARASTSTSRRLADQVGACTATLARSTS